MIDEQVADLPPGATDSTPTGGSSHRLAVLFLVLLGLLGLFSVTGTAVSALDSLLANPEQSCGGP